MARKKKKREGPEVCFKLACRQGFHVAQRTGRSDEGQPFLERMSVTQYALFRHILHQPATGVVADSVVCPGCSLRIRIYVASPAVAFRRRYFAALLIGLLGPFLLLPCLLIPAIRRVSSSALGSPYLIGLIVMGVIALLFLVFLLFGWMSPAPEMYAVHTGDHKHHILPAAFKGV